MPQNRAEPRVHPEEIVDLRLLSSKQKIHNDHGEDAFYDIAYHDDDAGLFAQGPEGICGPGVSGSCFADINSVESAIDIRSLEQTEGISDQEYNQTNHSFSSSQSEVLYADLLFSDPIL